MKESRKKKKRKRTVKLYMKYTLGVGGGGNWHIKGKEILYPFLWGGGRSIDPNVQRSKIEKHFYLVQNNLRISGPKMKRRAKEGKDEREKQLKN
jgi:hypothetical protein